MKQESEKTTIVVKEESQITLGLTVLTVNKGIGILLMISV